MPTWKFITGGIYCFKEVPDAGNIDKLKMND